MSSVIISGVAHLCPHHLHRQSSHMSPSAPLLRRRLCFVKSYSTPATVATIPAVILVTAVQHLLYGPDNRSTGELSIRITDPEATTPETELPMVERNLFFFLARIEDPEGDIVISENREDGSRQERFDRKARAYRRESNLIAFFLLS
ncbi:hypothetical protein Bca101_012904 [Brassica carinata]